MPTPYDHDWQAVRTQMDTLEVPVLLMRTNQPAGFDCPGCAWPGPASSPNAPS